MQINNPTRKNKAQIASIIANKYIGQLLLLVSLLLAAGGAGLVYTARPAGWLLQIPVVFVFMIGQWYRHDLKALDPQMNPEDSAIGNLLCTDILRKINKHNFNTTDVIEAAYSNNGRVFYHNRFFVSDDLLKTANCDIEAWWPSAVELWASNYTKAGVDGAHITAAILLGATNSQELLQAINYSAEEVLEGLKWYTYLMNAAQEISEKRGSGGIARDWAAGYTPLLNSYSQNLSHAIQYGGSTHRDILSHRGVVSQMISIYSNNGRANIALVGQTGSGKQMCVQGLADRLIFDSAISSKIRYLQIYQIDIANLLTTVSPAQLDSVLNRIMSEAYHAKNIILFFNNAGQLFGVDGGVDISNIMLPIIDAGQLRLIFSFNNSDWQYIQKNKPAMAAVLNYQAVMPASEQETISILENEAMFTEHQFKCIYTFASLKEVYRLADRYGPELAMPERAISVLNDVGRNSPGALVTPQQVQQTIEQTTGIKIGLATGAEKTVLLGLEQNMRKRVIGQDKAIQELSAALKRSRSGVSSSNKPIGTFLFLGPTGVGKTEVSKTLAAAYFGDENSLIRLDMNEFINPDSINRLLTTGNQSSPSFLDKIKQQPFSVVLLDEIEKAHPSLVNVFLQLFDEGTLTDVDNRSYSFRDSIIIATSNAGAEFIRNKIGQVGSIESLTNELTNQLIQDNIFKPELLNRFDDIIIFKPLGQAQLSQVVVVMLASINKELANQKITVSLSPQVIEKLASMGHDPAMGARPLKRLMQKTIETVVADKILQGQLSPGGTLYINYQDINWG